MIDEKKLQKDMKALGLTRAEVLQMYKDDEAIDHGEKLFELSAEQEKVAKKMRQADRAPTAYKFPKKARKPNEEKRHIIQIIKTLLEGFTLNETGENTVKVSNVERQIDFTLGNNSYSIQLICHRKAKG